jgi:hypothetical protein
MRFTSDNAREFGRRGGQATLARHGREHMARIGQAGFLALARTLGYVGGSRRGAVQQLQAAGRLKCRFSDLTMAEYRRLCREVGLED